MRTNQKENDEKYGVAEENYKAIWKDFPLFPFSFNRTIISFVIKYHLSSLRSLVPKHTNFKGERNSAVLLCIHIKFYFLLFCLFFGMPHVTLLVECFISIHGEYEFWVECIAFSFHLILRWYVFFHVASISVWIPLRVLIHKWQRVCLNIQQWYDCAVHWWWTKCNGWQKNAREDHPHRCDRARER